MRRATSKKKNWNNIVLVYEFYFSYKRRRHPDLAASTWIVRRGISAIYRYEHIISIFHIVFCIYLHEVSAPLSIYLFYTQSRDTHATLDNQNNIVIWQHAHPHTHVCNIILHNLKMIWNWRDDSDALIKIHCLMFILYYIYFNHEEEEVFFIPKTLHRHTKIVLDVTWFLRSIYRRKMESKWWLI